MLDIAAGLALVLATNALGMFSPGPDMLLLSRNSASPAPGPAYATVFGISTGIALHVALSVAGISGLALQHITVFRGFLFLAGLYLLYLGLRGLRQSGNANSNPSQSQTAAGLPPIRSGPAYLEGLLCNVLNVKAAAFFVSLFGLVIGPETTTLWRIALGVICVTQCVLLWSLFVWLLRRAAGSGLIQRRAAWARRFARGFNVLLLLAAAALIAEALTVFV